MSQPEYLTTAEVASMAKVHEGTVRNWRSAGVGPMYVKNGRGRALYRLSDVVAWIETGEVSTLDQQKRAA